MSSEEYASAVFHAVELKATTFAASDAVSKTYVDAEVASAKSEATQAVTDLLNGAPENLDTLKEIATALANDSDLAGTLTSSISAVSTKVDDETKRAGDAEAVLQTQINNENTYMNTATNINRDLIIENFDIAAAATLAEESSRIESVNGLQSALDTSVLTQIETTNGLQTAIDGEAASRIEAANGLESLKANLSGATFTGPVQHDSYLNFGVNWRVKGSADGTRLVFERLKEGVWKTAVPFISAP